MGAWAPDPFGNDTACDWNYSLEETDDLSLIESTLQKVHDAATEFLEAPHAEEAIAAADTIARLNGKFYVRNSYTESVDEWVAKHPITPPQALVDSAIGALERVQTDPSELLELWKESDDFAAWNKHMEDLKARLT
jgi:hypothetical protein